MRLYSQSLKTPYPPNQGLKQSPAPLTRLSLEPLKPLIHQTKDWNWWPQHPDHQSRHLKTPYPPNQGLKHNTFKPSLSKARLKTPYPPNQGLKHMPAPGEIQEDSLKTPYPPNQGLKHLFHRIGLVVGIHLKPLIHQTKDWNSNVILGICISSTP